MAATVDLTDIIPDLITELTVPGVVSFADATDDEWLGHLRSGFWEAVLDGIIVGYTEADGLVSPLADGGPVMSRELQQVIIYYAGLRVIRNRMIDIKTKSKQVAGPVSVETEQSAMVLKSLVDELVRRRAVWLNRLSDVGATDSFYVDSVIARSVEFWDEF